MREQSRPFRLRRRVTEVVVLASLIVLIAASVCLGGLIWDPEGVPAGTVSGDQFCQQIVSDGAGGAFVGWLNETSEEKMYAQRIGPDGVPLWNASGVSVCPSGGDQEGPLLATAGQAGAIMAWADDRDGSYTMYAQKLTPGGKAGWAPGGVPLSTGMTDQYPGAIAPDGAGGAIVAWLDNNEQDIYAQRIDASGKRLWTAAGVPVYTLGDSYARSLGLAGDGLGGAFFTWLENRSGTDGVFVQRVTPDGNVAWAAEGVPVSTGPGERNDPAITSDGMGNCVIAWASDTGRYDVMAQKLDRDGKRLWGNRGVDVCALEGDQYGIEIARSDSGGVVLAWQDDRSCGSDGGKVGASLGRPYNESDIYAQKLLASGAVAPGWAPGGVGVSVMAGYQMEPKVISDGAGGAVIAWVDGIVYTGKRLAAPVGVSSNVLVQRILAGGTPAPGWQPTGFDVRPDSELEGEPVLASDGAGGAIVAYSTAQTLNSQIRLHMQRVNADNSTWYLAEGSCAWGFQTRVTIENANSIDATARVTYMTPRGSARPREVRLPAMSQTSIDPAADLGYATDFSTKVECLQGLPIAVDRTMTWTGPGAPCAEAHCSVGVPAPGDAWYLPEGSSAWGFECWTLIQNPNPGKATCTLTYMIEGENPRTFEKEVPAHSRRTFNMAGDIGAKNASIRITSDLPVIPERSMYRNNRREGHVSIGTMRTSNNYFLAEGSTNYGFTTYVLVQNPNPNPTTVSVSFMTTAGPVSMDPFVMPAFSRKTILANDVLNGADFSTQVHADQQIIAERAMYWGADSALGEACHDSIGMLQAHTAFYLPDGQCSDGHETYTLVQNVNSTPVVIEVSYLGPEGKVLASFLDTVQPLSRNTYSMGDVIENTRAAIAVVSRTPGRKIMVERAMYWNNRGAGTATIGAFLD